MVDTILAMLARLSTLTDLDSDSDSDLEVASFQGRHIDGGSLPALRFAS